MMAGEAIEVDRLPFRAVGLRGDTAHEQVFDLMAGEGMNDPRRVERRAFHAAFRRRDRR